MDVSVLNLSLLCMYVSYNLFNLNKQNDLFESCLLVHLGSLSRLASSMGIRCAAPFGHMSMNLYKELCALVIAMAENRNRRIYIFVTFFQIT